MTIYRSVSKTENQIKSKGLDKAISGLILSPQPFKHRCGPPGFFYCIYLGLFKKIKVTNKSVYRCPTCLTVWQRFDYWFFGGWIKYEFTTPGCYADIIWENNGGEVNIRQLNE